MSLKNGIIASTICFTLSAVVCTTLLKSNKPGFKEGDEGEVITLSKFDPKILKKIIDGFVLLSGLYGFYYGYNNKTPLKLLT